MLSLLLQFFLFWDTKCRRMVWNPNGNTPTNYSNCNHRWMWKLSRLLLDWSTTAVEWHRTMEKRPGASKNSDKDQQINKNVVRHYRTIFFRFRKPYTVVSDNGKELISKDFKEWLKAHGCYKSDTPLSSPRSNGLPNEPFKLWKAAGSFSTNTLEVLWETLLIKFCFGPRN